MGISPLSSLSSLFGNYGFRLVMISWFIWLAVPEPSAWAAASAPPSPGMIRVDNRLSGTQDTVTVTGLLSGDVVKIYADAGSSIPLGSATVSSGLAGVTVNVGQLGAADGHIYVTVTQPSYTESRRIVKLFAAEPVSVAPSAASIRAINNASGTPDQVVIRGLQAGDTVKVYRDAQRSQLLGTATAAAGTTDETNVSVGQLGAAEGMIYVTVTKPGQGESRASEKAYAGEPLTAKPALGDIRVSNEYTGAGDRIEVSRLRAGDIVKVYASEQAAAPIGQATVTSGADKASVILPQLGTGEGVAYISVTRPPMLESPRLAKRYKSEPVTAAPAPSMIIISNEAGNMEDRVEVYGLASGDKVKVYPDATSSTVLGSSSAAAGSSRAEVKIPQLGKTSGAVYITVTSPTKGESRRVVKTFAAEQASSAPDRADIKILNAAGSNDLVTVTGLASGDIVKLYSDESSIVPISSAAVASGNSSVSVQTTLPGTGYGVLYVTVTRLHEEESPRTSKIYPAEPVSVPVSAHQIRVSNVTDGVSGDEVSVVGLRAGDKVRLYSDKEAASPIRTLDSADAEDTVENGEFSITINRLKLDPEGGEIYVSVTSVGKRESSRTVKAYEAE